MMNKTLIIITLLLFTYECNHAQYICYRYIDTVREKDFFTVNEDVVLFYYSNRDSTQTDFTRVKSYYNNGTLREEYCKDKDIMFGPYESFFLNGQVQCLYQTEYGNIKGTYFEFYPNGKKKEAGNYIMFPEDYTYNKINRDTIWTDSIFHDSFTIISRLNIVNHKNFYWDYWDSTGNLIHEELWKNGNLIKSDNLGNK